MRWFRWFFTCAFFDSRSTLSPTHKSADCSGANGHPLNDKTRQDNHSTESRSLESRFTTTKSAYRFWTVNISQSETALCSAELAQSGADAMVPLVPWPVHWHQRLDSTSESAGCLAARKKKTQERRIVNWTSSAHWIFFTPISKTCAASQLVTGRAQGSLISL